jgi:hypothetical protein
MEYGSTRPRKGSWQSLYRIGGSAPLITLAIYIGQVVVTLLAGYPYPANPEAWFQLFQRSKILGLIYLNAFDVFSIGILGLMFLALAAALWQVNPSLTAMAAFTAFLGIAVFVASRALMVSAAVNLNDQFALALTDEQKYQLLTAWKVITSPARATPETTGFLFIALASLVFSIVMLQAGTFRKTIAILGFAGCLVTIADQVSLVLAPTLALVLMPLNGALWLVWWLLVSRALFRLARNSI